MSQYLIYAILALQVLDVASTLYAFRNGAVEGNKVMAYLISKLGKVPGLLIPKVIYGIFAWWIFNDYSVNVNWMYGLFAVYSLVILNNLRLGLNPARK